MRRRGWSTADSLLAWVGRIPGVGPTIEGLIVMIVNADEIGRAFDAIRACPHCPDGVDPARPKLDTLCIVHREQMKDALILGDTGPDRYPAVDLDAHTEDGENDG